MSTHDIFDFDQYTCGDSSVNYALLDQIYYPVDHRIKMPTGEHAQYLATLRSNPFTNTTDALASLAFELPPTTTSKVAIEDSPADIGQLSNDMDLIMSDSLRPKVKIPTSDYTYRAKLPLRSAANIPLRSDGLSDLVMCQKQSQSSKSDTAKPLRLGTGCRTPPKVKLPSKEAYFGTPIVREIEQIAEEQNLPMPNIIRQEMLLGTPTGPSPPVQRPNVALNPAAALFVPRPDAFLGSAQTPPSATTEPTTTAVTKPASSFEDHVRSMLSRSATPMAVQTPVDSSPSTVTKKKVGGLRSSKWAPAEEAAPVVEKAAPMVEKATPEAMLDIIAHVRGLITANLPPVQAAALAADIVKPIVLADYEVSIDGVIFYVAEPNVSKRLDFDDFDVHYCGQAIERKVPKILQDVPALADAITDPMAYPSLPASVAEMKELLLELFKNMPIIMTDKESTTTSPTSPSSADSLPSLIEDISDEEPLTDLIDLGKPQELIKESATPQVINETATKSLAFDDDEEDFDVAAAMAEVQAGTESIPMVFGPVADTSDKAAPKAEPSIASQDVSPGDLPSAVTLSAQIDTSTAIEMPQMTASQANQIAQINPVPVDDYNSTTDEIVLGNITQLGFDALARMDCPVSAYKRLALGFKIAMNQGKTFVDSGYVLQVARDVYEETGGANRAMNTANAQISLARRCANKEGFGYVPAKAFLKPTPSNREVAKRFGNCSLNLLATIRKQNLQHVVFELFGLRSSIPASADVRVLAFDKLETANAQLNRLAVYNRNCDHYMTNPDIAVHDSDDGFVLHQLAFYTALVGSGGSGAILEATATTRRELQWAVKESSICADFMAIAVMYGDNEDDCRYFAKVAVEDGQFLPYFRGKSSGVPSFEVTEGMNLRHVLLKKAMLHLDPTILPTATREEDDAIVAELDRSGLRSSRLPPVYSSEVAQMKDYPSEKFILCFDKRASVKDLCNQRVADNKVREAFEADWIARNDKCKRALRKIPLIPSKLSRELIYPESDGVLTSDPASKFAAIDDVAIPADNTSVHVPHQLRLTGPAMPASSTYIVQDTQDEEEAVGTTNDKDEALDLVGGNQGDMVLVANDDEAVGVAVDLDQTVYLSTNKGYDEPIDVSTENGGDSKNSFVTNNAFVDSLSDNNDIEIKGVGISLSHDKDKDSSSDLSSSPSPDISEESIDTKDESSIEDAIITTMDAGTSTAPLHTPKMKTAIPGRLDPIINAWTDEHCEVFESMKRRRFRAFDIQDRLNTHHRGYFTHYEICMALGQKLRSLKYLGPLATRRNDECHVLDWPGRKKATPAATASSPMVQGTSEQLASDASPTAISDHDGSPVSADLPHASDDHAVMATPAAETKLAIPVTCDNIEVVVEATDEATLPRVPGCFPTEEEEVDVSFGDVIANPQARGALYLAGLGLATFLWAWS